MNITRIDDFDKDGKINWTEYHKAQLQNGDICTECGAYIVWSKGVPSKCSMCRGLLDEKGEVNHEKRVRCPKCGYTWDPRKSEDYQLFENGTHNVSCCECDHDFEVTTDVSYTFTSPERLKEEVENEDGEDDSLAEE